MTLRRDLNGNHRSDRRAGFEAARQDHPRPAGARPRQAGADQAAGRPGNGGDRRADAGDRRRGAVDRSLDQPGPAELPLCDVRADPVGDPDGPDRRRRPGHGDRHRQWHDRLPARHAGGALRALRHRLPRLHRRADLGEGEGRRRSSDPGLAARAASPLFPHPVRTRAGAEVGTISWHHHPGGEEGRQDGHRRRRPGQPRQYGHQAQCQEGPAAGRRRQA